MVVSCSLMLIDALAIDDASITADCAMYDSWSRRYIGTAVENSRIVTPAAVSAPIITSMTT